jgi:hypothetical protein
MLEAVRVAALIVFGACLLVTVALAVVAGLLLAGKDWIMEREDLRSILHNERHE